MIFMGSDGIALPLLDFLVNEGREAVEVAGVITQPDRPSGRGKKLGANAVKRWAMDLGLPVWQPGKPGEREVALLRELKTDLVLVMAYGHILKRAMLEAPPLGTYNLHTSLLPAYRGASPVQGALASGDSETGVTLMRMIPRMDAGPIVDQEKFRIGRRETALSLEAKLGSVCVPLLRRNLEGMRKGEAPEREQEETRASYTLKLTKEDGALDFSRPARPLACRINALYPWPGCTIPAGETRIKIGLADYSAAETGENPGTVTGGDRDGLKVATGSGTLRLLELQRPGGRMLAAGEFLRGFPIPPGTVFESCSMSELVRRNGPGSTR